MTNLISREAVIALINASISDLEYSDENIAMQEAIKMLPTIEAEPVKHGTWTKKESKRYWWYECSECGSYPPSDRYRREWLANYCPNCGAKMDEVEK